MGSFSIWHWLVVLVIVLLLFGGGRVSSVMGEFGKGLKAFKKGMEDETSSTPRNSALPDSADKVDVVQKEQSSHH